jgi:hypothetical protein
MARFGAILLLCPHEGAQAAMRGNSCIKAIIRYSTRSAPWPHSALSGRPQMGVPPVRSRCQWHTRPKACW